MNDTSKIASAINDLQNAKIPVKIDGENKTIYPSRITMMYV